MKKLAAMLLFLAGCCCHDVTPWSIRRDVKTMGAAKTVDKLYQHVGESDWHIMIEGIVSGEDKWLAIVPLIKPGTDAGATFELILSLSEALPKNPSGVLKVIEPTGDVLSYANICKSPIMEGGTLQEEKDYYASAKAALENLKDPAVEKQRVKCLDQIQKQIRKMK